jgi:hypothetical protein
MRAGGCSGLDRAKAEGIGEAIYAPYPAEGVEAAAPRRRVSWFITLSSTTEDPTEG